MPGQPDEPGLFSRSGRPEAHQKRQRGGRRGRRGVEVAAAAGELPPGSLDAGSGEVAGGGGE